MDQNQPEKKKEVLQETTPEVIQQAKTIIRTARYGAIATIDPETGAPVCTRIGVSTDIDGAPVVLISRLTAHTNALLKDPRGSLLLGTPGKGDALAHARITIAIEAREIERDSDEAKRLGQRYLCHQPKAQLYAQLGDFRYFKFEPKGASMNGGFGKAYVLTREQLLTLSDSNAELAEAEISAIEHMQSTSPAHRQANGAWSVLTLKAWTWFRATMCAASGSRPR
jgi:putative heme iron utilization protein